MKLILKDGQEITVNFMSRARYFKDKNPDTGESRAKESIRLVISNVAEPYDCIKAKITADGNNKGFSVANDNEEAIAIPDTYSINSISEELDNNHHTINITLTED